MTNNKCPYCGATLQKIQGYNFVCEYCGKTTPVDAQTRAAIDAQHNEQIRQHTRAKEEKTLKKGCFIAIISAVAILVSLTIINKCQRDKIHEQMDKYKQERLDKINVSSSNSYSQSPTQHNVIISIDDFYISPNNIFTNSGKESIGHLKQDLKDYLSQRGFVLEGTERMSYYGSNNNSGAPLISVKFNFYFPTYSNCDRKNETDDIHSLFIEINDETLYNDFKARFIKELRSIGFAKEDVTSRGYESSIEMIGKDFLRIGDVIKSKEGYFSKTYCNWESVELLDYKRTIECVAFREF